MKRLYAETSYGQVHLRYLKARGQQHAPPLVCLHAMPFSGLHFAKMAEYLNQGRDVILPDYPGYGGSDKLDSKPSINDFAKAVIEALDDIGVEGACDFLGFHTGCLVGPEISLIMPEKVRKLVLVDVPYFDKEQREGMYDSVVSYDPISSELSCLDSAWEFCVTNQIDCMPLQLAYDLFVEKLRAGNDATLGFHAAFTYPCEERFPSIKHPTLVVATQSGLLNATLKCAEMTPGSTLAECYEVKRIVMETGVEPVSKLALEYLSDS